MASQVAAPPVIKPPQKKSMAKQKDATGRCAVRPQRTRGSDGKASRGKEDLTEIYGILYARVPFESATEVALARGFSDKELRVLMGMNKMLINDYNPETGKYTEKTKANKIKALLPNLKNLARPEDIEKCSEKPTKAKRVSTKTVSPPVSSSSPPPAIAAAATPDPPEPVKEQFENIRPPSPVLSPPASCTSTMDAKVVTPLELPRGIFEDEAARASSFICAAMALRFSNACVERRSAYQDSAITIRDQVLLAGVEAYRNSDASHRGQSICMDDVVEADFLGESLRIVDVCAFSRRLRYPSTVDIVISQLCRVPGSMCTFLYGHESFSGIVNSGSTLFIGFCCTDADSNHIFKVVDPRNCNPETGLPSRTGSPAMMLLLGKSRLRDYLMELLRGEGGSDVSAVDWQASFLEVKPTGSPDDASCSGDQQGLWISSDTLSFSAPITTPPALADVVGDSGTPHIVENSCDEMDRLQQSLERSSLDDDVPEAPQFRDSLDVLDQQDSLAASMERSSLDDMEFLPELGAQNSIPSLESSVQAAIRQETEKQRLSQSQWQAEMSSRMNGVRHGLETSYDSCEADYTTPPCDEPSKRKRHLSLTSQLGAAFRRNTRKNKGAGKFISRHSIEDEEDQPVDFHVQQHNTISQVIAAPDLSPLRKDVTAKSPADSITRYTVHLGDSDADLVVSPTGVNISDGDTSTFYHLTTIQSWRVRRLKSRKPVGFKLVMIDGSEVVLSTEQGKEISDTMMKHAKGLAALMQGGMHVRGTAMVN